MQLERAMTEETQAEMPIEDAPVLPVEQAADSSPADDVESVETEKSPDDVGERPRDEDGKFLSAKAQKRIDELTWRANEREREAAFWRAQAEARQQPEPPKVEVIKPPTLEEHGYDEAKYQAAVAQYATEIARAEVRKELEADRTRTSEQQRTETFKQRVAKSPVAAQIASDPFAPISKGMSAVIQDSETAAELLEWIAENREQAGRIYALPDHLAAKELGKVEALLEARKAPKPKPPVVTKAPPPAPTIETVDADTTTPRASDPASDSMDIDAWRRAREKQVNRKR